MRNATLLNTLTKGVLDPALSERIDLKHYYDGLASALNIESTPQGGGRRRAGTTAAQAGKPVQRLRRRVVPMSLSAGMISAPNGGTVAYLIDQEEETRFVTSSVSGAAFVVAQINLGSVVPVCFVDLLSFACASGRFPRQLSCEWWNGAAWVGFAPTDRASGRTISSGISTGVDFKMNVPLKASDGGKATFVAPYDGKITQLRTVLDGPIEGADATVSLDIEGVAVTNGAVTIAQAGSAAGDVDTAVPTATSTFKRGELITATVGGGVTNAQSVDIEVYWEEAQRTRSRRWALRPGEVVETSIIRIVAYNSAGAGAISVGGIRLWSELSHVSPSKGFSFARTSDLVYEAILTDRNIDIFRDGVWWSAVPADIDASQIGEIVVTQSEENAFFYHEDVETQWLQQQGANDEWNMRGMPYARVPSLNGSGFADDQDEVQDIDFKSMATGQVFCLWLGARVTAPISFNAATVADDVRSALLAIGVPTGLTVERLSGYAVVLRIWFSGTAGGRRWPVVLVAPVTGTATPTTTIAQRGLDGNGPTFGGTTGWPRCGIIYQERHLVAGFRASPNAYGFSRYGDALDFTDEGDPFTADLALFGKLNTDRLEVIHQIAVGRNIHLLTDSGEWYMEARTVDATQPPNVTWATGNGIKSSVQTVTSDGATLFVQKGGRVLRELVYSDVELSYKAEPLNLLGPHLLTDVVAMAHRPARDLAEGNQLFCVNADGSIAFASLLKGQEVVAFTPWQAAAGGKYRDVLADPLLRVWVIVERSVSGVTDLYLEKLDGTHTLDAAVIYDHGGAATSLVAGLDHLEGEDVWAWIDRALVGPLKVANGEVALPVAGARVVVGLFPRLHGRLPRIREKLQNEKPFRPPARIYEVGISIAGTGQLDIAVNGGPFREVPLTAEDGLGLDIAAEPPRDTSGITTGASASDQMERTIRAVDMIPGSGEFVYSSQIITRTEVSSGAQVRLNMHNTTDDPDFLVSLGQMRQALPNLRNVALFTTWFGSDLRAGSCQIKPKVDQYSEGLFTYSPYDWSVAGVVRDDADLVSISGGTPVYGGTPADRSVVEGIHALKAHAIAVTFTPFIIMDLPAGNGKPDPYGGVEQAPHPWRGRITCYPAPGMTGTVDLTASAATQVAAFVGTCQVSDFAVSDGNVIYSGPPEWSYRRFILHYAHLCKAAGGVDTFVIGSEMRGLTWVRSAAGVYPFVAALVQLADDVKSVLGAETKVTYASDWSEFVPHQPPEGGGGLYFHLDPLWSSASIDAIGMDNYWPLSDWRDGEGHLDMIAGTRFITDRAYLQSNIAGGEGYDWYYASEADRNAQVRTSIADGAYGKAWVYRYKDIQNWWRNAHYDRPGGVEAVTPTSWLPQSKPIWFMEIGCPAVDKGPNQPNVFYDPKSSESFFPYYSHGIRDDAVQRAYIEALTGYYTPGQTGWRDENNPISAVDGRRMVDHTRIYVYCWDARFYPAFPDLDEVWADGDLWRLGHWITGRVFASVELDPRSLPVGVSAELPMRDRLITGTVRVTNLRGFSRHPSFEFSQSVPAPLEIRAIRLELAYRG